MSSISTAIFYVFLSVITFLLASKKNLEKTFLFLGLTSKKFSVKQTLFDSIALFFVIVSLLAVESIVLSFFSLDDSSKVAATIAGLSIPAVIVASTLGPFAEELFFRGFLQKYAGVIITSILFAILHFSFGSITEVIGAFTASLAIGYWVKYRNQFLWPAIIAHAGYNVMSILVVFVST